MDREDGEKRKDDEGDAGMEAPFNIDAPPPLPASISARYQMRASRRHFSIIAHKGLHYFVRHRNSDEFFLPPPCSSAQDDVSPPSLAPPTAQPVSSLPDFLLYTP